MSNQRRLVSFDWAIKRLLRSKANFDVLEGFLSELLSHDIKILRVLGEESNQASENNKHNRVDVLVEDETGGKTIIEVQYEYESDFFFRIQYAAAKVLSESLPKGAEYKDLPKVISVSILYFDLGQGRDYVYHGITQFKGMHYNDELQLSTDQKEVFSKDLVYEVFPEHYLLKINNFDDVAKNGLDEWIHFLKTEQIDDNTHARGLKAAKLKLDYLGLSEQERIDYDKHLSDIREMRSLASSQQRLGYCLAEAKFSELVEEERKMKEDAMRREEDAMRREEEERRLKEAALKELAAIREQLKKQQ